jgi:prepilin-type N-terminal cleavage/methylation domain-containing protein
LNHIPGGTMDQKKGFTLIELMIVVAIIAFLSLIAAPSFLRYLAKAKRVEAYMNLNALYMAQKAYFAEYGTYSSQLSGPNSVGWQPEGYKGGGAQESFNYTYGFPGAEGATFYTGKLETPASNLAQGYANTQGFLALAAADIDGDGVADVLSVDQDNTIRIVQDDIS